MMAASSGGDEWSYIIKKNFSTGCDTSKDDLLELCLKIVKNEVEILQFKEGNNVFYNSLAALSADYIGCNANSLSFSHLEIVTAGCRVLLKFFISILQTVSREGRANVGQTERCLKAIQALCFGIGILTQTEFTILTNAMKGETAPTHSIPSGSDDLGLKQESSKSKSDLSVSIFKQLTLPLRDGHTATTESPTIGQVSVAEIATSNDPSTEIHKLFKTANTETLQQLRAGDTLADLCLSLPTIKRARTKVDDALAGKPFSLPTSHSEATTVRNNLPSMVADIELAKSAIHLPVLEPLTPSKLDKLCNLSMAALYCAISQAAASSILSLGTAVSPKCTSTQVQAAKEEDLDANAVVLIEEALNIHTFIGTIIKNSTRAGGHVFQNHLLAGSWVLISGLQTLISHRTSIPEESHSRERDDKGRSPSKSRESGSGRSVHIKFQQSFGVLSVALSSRALLLLSELFDDLHLEVCGGGSTVQVEPAPLAIMGQFSALQRVARVLGAAPLNQLLFYLATVSYRKASTLKRIHPPEGDTFSQSDSTTYYEDMILCSDESSTEDDDSEPILGQWFEETLAPPETTDPKASCNAENTEVKSSQIDRVNSIVPEKGEPHGYISLCTQIFLFMNRHFLCSKSAYVTRYVNAGLTEQQMLILAAIIKDLDRETARTEIGTISVYFGAPLGSLYCEFSSALTRFTHNLVTNIGLDTLQASLLSHLGVSPWNTDVPHAWPLQVYPRTLAVLAQVLLLRSQNEKEASVISIWHRLVNTLIESVINPPSVIDTENEDLNVEHAQVLLYLFHSLNLMQKKSVVLLMAGGVLRCSEVARGPLRDSQLIHLSRLLLLFDYIMKHLYDAPPVLLEQIQWNLFYSTNLNTEKEKENNMSRMFTPWREIEDNFRRISGNDEFTMKPRFYIITNMEMNNQDASKLDGLACNFILGTPDKLKYPLLLDALIEILNVTHITSGTGSLKMTYLGLCATQYCFTICWRLLQLLPPSAPYMQILASSETLAAGPMLLHSLIWGPRTGHKNFNRWLKDALVKQGLYTQHTEKLLKTVTDTVGTLKYDITTAKNVIVALTPDIKKGTMSKESLPPLWHLFLLDAVLAKVQISLIDETETNTADASGIIISGATYVQDLLPNILRLTQAILHCLRWSLLHCMLQQSEPPGKFNLQDFEGLQEVLAIASSRNSLTNALATELSSLLPTAASTVLQQWNESTLEDCTWTPYLNDIIPSESYIMKIIDIHISTLSMAFPFSINLSLKRLLQCLIKFICQYAPKTENTDTKNRAIELLVSITLDLRTEFLHENVSKTLDKMIGDTETDEHQKRVYLHFLENSYKLIINHTSSTTSNVAVDEKMLHACLKFYEKILEKSSGRQALETFFTGERDLVKVLMSVSSPQMSQQYSTRVLHLFNKLFQTAEKSTTDPSLNYLCSSMSKLANVESDKLQIWLRHVILGPNNMTNSSSSSNVQTPTLVVATSSKPEASPIPETPSRNTPIPLEGAPWNASSDSNPSPSPTDDQKLLVQENSQLLQALTSYIVRQGSNVSEDVATTILKALLPVGSHILSPALEGSGFTELMVVMTMLADAGVGKGHIHLFPAAVEWLDMCKQYLAKKESVDKLATDPMETTKNNVMLDAACCLLDYVGDLVGSLTSQAQSLGFRAFSPPWEGEAPVDMENEWPDELNDEDDSGDESDEDALCNKLCTFTVTQKEFMNQHWYHCHTCRMLDGVGVCSVCARVCHKGHEVTYAKCGNFFCDCGAKEDGTCLALVKRSPQTAPERDVGVSSSSNVPIGYTSENMLTSSLRRRASSPIAYDRNTLLKNKKTGNIVKQLEGSREWLFNYFGSCAIPSILVELLQALIPAVEAACSRTSPIGCHARALKALQELHSTDKKYTNCDNLMSVSVSSQEGAFENVRMSYAGEQGQTIRQLLSAHIVRRMTMACLSSPNGKKQHLVVAHEKGKITVLQLAALLRQGDTVLKKLALTKLASAPIPFTVLTLASNPCNDEFLAVCGLKDCHVLIFASTGSVTERIVLHPQLETGNFIIKAIWLPGSQTELALITADFVKIYDLSKDALSPLYYFLVPSGKIRDCTFMYEYGIYNILLMSSPGHIYTEVLNDESSAKHGSFYVTNTLEVFNIDVTDVSGQVAGGGVSIYYSHTLGLLFYSYAQGKSFISPFTSRSNCLTMVFPITLSSAAAGSGSKSNGGKTPTLQPLCQWSEIPNHPGLVYCTLQSSNNPVVIMLKPDSVAVQEIKIVPTKSKITDVVGIRHLSTNDARTTILLLCEDGTLKLYVAIMEQTGFWLSPNIQPAITHPQVKPRKKKIIKPGKSSSSLTFPTDFFEHCQPMNDIEVGGNDLLQIYNAAQLKQRLNTTGTYAVCCKPLGFSMEITNSDHNMVITGIRVLVGSQDPHRSPSFIEIFGRIVTISINRSRWFDLPLTREESLQADKKITIMFGASQDPETVTMVDSVKLYGKTKDNFGWPEENDESTNSTSLVPANATNSSSVEADQGSNNSQSLTTIEKLTIGILEILDYSFSIYLTEEKLVPHKPLSLSVATSLLTLPLPPSLQMYLKGFLSALHTTKQNYHGYKDHALLQHVHSTLLAMTEIDPANYANIDAENYYRLVMIVRGIANNRPQNLVKFADSQTSIQDVLLDDPLDVKIKTSKNQHILLQLMDVLWILHSQNPENPDLVPVVIPGLKHTEQIIHALVEIVHAFNSCDAYSNITIAVYLQLLLCEDSLIAFSAKQAINRVLKPKCRRRRVFIPSPPHCGTPPGKSSTEIEKEKPRATPQLSQEDDRQSRDSRYDIDSVESIGLLEQAGGSADNHNMNPLEALLGGGAGFPPILDIPPDADDETMVELAIALSLQEHELSGGMPQGQVLHSLQVAVGQAQEAGHYSDTTVSAAGSDDEGSTAATDGSTLRTSPAEQAGSAGSESGGSGVDSITGEHNVSGRSSAYGDNIQEAITLVSRSDTSSVANANFQAAEADNLQPEIDLEQESESSCRLHLLRLQLLEKLIEYLPKLRNVDGIRAIPFLQVVLQLTTDIDGKSERDKNCINSLLTVLTSELQINKSTTEEIWQRTKPREVQLVLMRLLSSILMARSKSSLSSKSYPSDNSTFVAHTTATFLYKADLIGYCLKLLQSLIEYWNRHPGVEEDMPVLGDILLKKRLPRNSPDISPFFVKHYMKVNTTDVFDSYPEFLTEMALRLPYQIHKQSDSSDPVAVAFENTWYKILCEYMMASQPGFVRRQVRKLLMFICGNKERYRQLRDVHALNTHMKAVKLCCNKGGYTPGTDIHHSLSLSYDTLVELVEHLKACLEIALSRTGNWQRYCIHNEDILSFLLQVSCLLDEGVAPTILHLVQSAITNIGSNSIKKDTNNATGKANRKEREKSDDSAADALFEEGNCQNLIEQINKQISKEVLLHFIKTFLLETNATNIRMQAHTIIFAIYKNSKLLEQNSLLQLLWKLWPLLAFYGRKAAQFVDLLGYFFHRFAQNNRETAVQQIGCYVDKAVEVLKSQNELLAHHANTNLYLQMSQYVEIDGYYLESDPCLVCNNPEVPLSIIKLSSLKADSKFTTTTQIVKLVGCHTVSKITIRIGDLKRTKMVRTINIYYNNRSVQAVVELKNKPSLWHKAKKVGLLSGQTEVKVEFPLPIVACNLMIEYADFYENIHANSETLQCPRCSAAVPSNPGVCANCGENVFQCHKCRAINYDEKDPFLCHACGFCKYAKFDFTLIARPCCAVESIENEDDRKKMVSSINTLLEKADRVYKQLMGNKPTLESLVMKITEQRVDRKEDSGPGGSTNAPNNMAPAPSGAQVKVNKTIQMLAQQYCNDCKTSFEELSKIIQRVLVSRKELVAYDRKHRDAEVSKTTSVSSLNPQPSTSKELDPFTKPNVTNINIRCYGCCSAASEHCLTLLRTLAMNATTRQILCSKGLVQELVWNNLRKGTVQMQEEVRKLLRILATDNFEVTEELCNILTKRIMLSLSGHASSYDFITGVHHEIALLGVLVQKEDKCWELKLRFLFKIFLKASNDCRNPLIMDSVILPCLEIMLNVIKPRENTSKKAKDKINTTIATSKLENNMTDIQLWLNQQVSFVMWLRATPRKLEDSQKEIPKEREMLHSFYLSEKYSQRWRNKVRHCKTLKIINFNNTAWMKAVLFSPSSRSARQVSCSIIEFMCIDRERRRDFLVLLTRFLKELTSAGESASEFLTMFQNLIQEPPWKQYLTLHGILIDIADLVTKEIEHLHHLEETTLTSDLTQGYALFHLIELLASFLEDPAIRRQYKSRLVGAVLNGYLSLRGLVVQRTRLIDDTQEKLLDLLEDMTSGTEEETKAFMAVCIQTIEKYSTQDVLTPVFIFERLCSIIYPEENDVGEFFLTLEKDSQQEDFLQGRMLGNPYSSLESGLGPLMRDVKNKICQDCELVALLEDDNGMELLVNNKIMSLDLPVKDVYKKVWLQEGGESDSMRVVYRMRGLLGDATEEFVEKLSNKTQNTVDNEEVYKMANVLADCGGLQVMVNRLGAIQSIWRARPLLQVLLKLFRLSVKVERVQEVLIQPELGAMEVFLHTLQVCLDGEPDSNQAALTEQLLDIMETILAKATSKSIESFKKFSQTFGGPEYISSLLSCTNHTSVRNNQPVLEHLTRVLAALVYGNEEKMKILVQHFTPILNFNKYDFEHTQDDQQKLEMFCVLTAGIEKNAIGNTLKDYIVALEIVKDAVEYITMHAPCVKPTLLRTDSDELKEFISKPALKYILRFLTGLASNHEKTQLAIAAADTIPIIHRLEQVSSDEHVGSLAENLLEAIRTNPTVATRIEEAREFTRSEKKRLAMAMREKQLGQLGMHTNDKGQVTAKFSILQQMEELGEETGLVCCICREGYKYQPTKVLGIYTFTKRCNVEEYESKPRKTIGYNTVTHFNVVHVDCHMSAVRLARARDEWESAALQNANTKCNGLLPLWGPQVPESAFASCLARHNTYLQESTNHRNIGHSSTIQDIKLVLLRFAQEKSFHDDTGGGGPQSNMHLIPYLIHMTLYVINTTRASKREEASLTSYLENTNYEKWVESSYEAEGPLYWLVHSLMVHSHQTWLKRKISHLRKLIVLAQARHCTPSGPNKTISDKTVKEYSVYKPYLVLFGLIDGIYYYFFKNVTGTDEQWSNNLADYIRHNDEAMVKASERLLDFYTDELLPCTCFLEFCDVAGLLNDIARPDEYIKDVLNGIS